MTTPAQLFRLLTALVVVAAASLALLTASSTAEKHRNVFWVDLAGSAEKAPRFVYFTANAGGQVHSIKWKNWGGRKAIGRGIFRNTAPANPGQPNQNGPAKLIARKPVKCTPEFGDKQGRTIRVYRQVKLIYPNGRGGKTRTSVTDRAGWLTCRQSR